MNKKNPVVITIELVKIVNKYCFLSKNYHNVDISPVVVFLPDSIF